MGDGQVQGMVEGDVGSFDTRYERLTAHYRDLIVRGSRSWMIGSACP